MSGWALALACLIFTLLCLGASNPIWFARNVNLIRFGAGVMLVAIAASVLFR